MTEAERRRAPFMTDADYDRVAWQALDAAPVPGTEGPVAHIEPVFVNDLYLACGAKGAQAALVGLFSNRPAVTVGRFRIAVWSGTRLLADEVAEMRQEANTVSGGVSDAMLAALKAGSDVRIVAVDAGYSFDATYPLRGSSRAISALPCA